MKLYAFCLVDMSYSSIYTAALSAGVGAGVLISGLITITLHWRYIYWISAALIGTCTLLVIFTLPETEFDRRSVAATESTSSASDKVEVSHNETPHSDPAVNAEMGVGVQQFQKRSYLQALSLYSGVYTRESFLKLFFRPVILLLLPPVFWATLVMSVTIGFLVAISSNFATAFQTVYGFEPWQSGLCFVSTAVSSLVALFFGGMFSDWVADALTRRNGGVREPEMRLPALSVAMVTAPLALVLYGVGIERGLHWIVPTLGLAFCMCLP
jgi:MFS family permease